MSFKNKMENEKEKEMENGKLIEKMDNDKTVEKIGQFIVNNLGINLCSVEDITVNRQEDGQLTDVQIKFIPNNEED